MSVQSGPAPDDLKPDYHKWVLVLLAALTVYRVVSLFYSPLYLHGDEAQYWSWSRNFDWGYFSKPPMIAWLIGATTTLFGNEEWAVRLSSPLIHPVTAYVLFRTGRFMFSARSGFYAACLYFLMPAVWLSSAIVSTDVALLMFWALALNAWAHLRETPGVNWAALLGLWIGLGMLSKYAMLFFIIAIILVVFIDPKTRTALLSKNGLLAALIAALVVAPNLLWNAANDFATVGHTASNANLKGVPFNPGELLDFWGSQFGVFGPLTLILMFACLFLALRGKLDRTVFVLAIFALLPFIVISAQALISRANANWAVTSYIAGSLVAAYGIDHLRGKYSVLGKAGILLNLSAGLAFSVISLSPSLTDKAGLANSTKRLRAWPQTVTQITDIAKAGHDGENFIALATDNRLSFFDFTYYGLEDKTGVALRSWLFSKHVNHHAEASAPLRPSTVEDGPVLIINYYKNYEKYFREDFERLEPITTLEIALGGGKTRVYTLWAGYGYTPTDTFR